MAQKNMVTSQFASHGWEQNDKLRYIYEKDYFKVVN